MEKAADLTFLCFDHGTRRIGVAVGQTRTRTAQGVATLILKGSAPDWERISGLVAEWEPDAFVVGLPLDGSGGETDMSRKARRFGQSLAGRYNLDVHWVNEFLSTEAARDVLAGRGRQDARALKDQVAASLILETFMNEQRGGQRIEDEC